MEEKQYIKARKQLKKINRKACKAEAAAGKGKTVRAQIADELLNDSLGGREITVIEKRENKMYVEYPLLRADNFGLPEKQAERVVGMELIGVRKTEKALFIWAVDKSLQPNALPVRHH